MAKRGPKPIPKPTLRLRRSWRGKDNVVELDAKAKMPKRLIEVQGHAKKCWEYIVPKLYKMGLATDLNRYSLAMLCWAWEDVVESRELLESTRNKKGRRALLIKTSAGGKGENPLVYSCNRAFAQFNKMATCFGLTPSDMAGVTKVEKPAKSASKARYFSGA